MNANLERDSAIGAKSLQIKEISISQLRQERHQKIIAAEVNPERKALYQLCWHLGASQGDIANLKGEEVDWTNSTVSFRRQKTRVPRPSERPRHGV